jgi:hypothetical protein
MDVGLRVLHPGRVSNPPNVPSHLMVRARSMAVAATTAVLVGGCINVFFRTEVVPVAYTGIAERSVIQSPVKAHLADGSTVVFAGGATVTPTEITGNGISYPLLSRTGVARSSIPLDSVVGVEAFEQRVLAAQSVVVSIAATAAGMLGTAALLVAIFGSCPTVYADSAGTPILQAEGFSYSIAPLLEHRDVDPLRVQPGLDGAVRLELRNEALETHFINHIELLGAVHAAGTRVVPDQAGEAVTVGSFRPLARAVDRAERDIRATLAEPDGRLFSSAPSVVDAAREGDLDDWIDLVVNDLPPGDSIAVVLRLRNSLLNTVLLYDGVLGGRDAPDWLGRDLQRIAAVTDLARWYVATMGLRAFVGDSGSASGIQRAAPDARLGDVGPLAFRDVALVLPRPAPDAPTARVRLRFIADNWRIDHAEVAAVVTRPALVTVPLAAVHVETPATGGPAAVDTAALAALTEADDRYLETRPGQSMKLIFAPMKAQVSADSTMTYLMTWQGWYREWIRGSWLAKPSRTTPFVPGDAAILKALRQWRAQQADFERQFYNTRIPVR